MGLDQAYWGDPVGDRPPGVPVDKHDVFVVGQFFRPGNATGLRDVAAALADRRRTPPSG